MFCHVCRVRLRPDFPYCLHCGTPRKGTRLTDFAAPTLGVNGRAIPLVRTVTTIGRDAGNDVVLAHSSVSRRHARIVRSADGYRIEDLGSFNGTSVGDETLLGGDALLRDSTELFIGDVPAVFAQPRGTRLASKTMVRPVEQTMLDQTAPTATGALSARPRRRSGWALKRLAEPGEKNWVLRNTRTGDYLELTDRDVFLWEQLAQDCTVGDLLYAYSERYGELALPRIEATLRAFAGVGLLTGLADGQARQRTPGRILHKVLFDLQVSIGGLDTAFGRIYRAFGWWFFTRPAVVLLGALIIAGLAAFGVATSSQRLLDVGGAGVWGAIVVGASYLVALAVHEAAHALAVKSYGRTVTRAGFLLMLFLPFAFVDTSDMWFADRRARIVVTLAGPLSTLAIAGALSLTAAFAADTTVAGIAFQLAFGLYLNTLYNGNPLMPLDGYRVLTDALRIPRLREEALGYLFRGLWSDLRAGHRPSGRNRGLLAYGLAALAVMVLMLVTAVYAWQSRLADLLGEPYASAALFGVGLLFVALLLWSLTRYRQRAAHPVSGENPAAQPIPS